MSAFPAVRVGDHAKHGLLLEDRPGAGAQVKLSTGGAFIDAPYGARKGAAIGSPKRGKGTKIIALADDDSLPLAVSVESVSPHENQLVEDLLGHQSSHSISPASANIQHSRPNAAAAYIVTLTAFSGFSTSYDSVVRRYGGRQS
jgi:hypothetical protein